jgi:hypothetical protein
MSYIKVCNLQGSGSSQKQGLLCFKTLRLQVATCKNERVGGVFKKPPPLSKAPATLAHSLSQSTLNTMPPPALPRPRRHTGSRAGAGSQAAQNGAGHEHWWNQIFIFGFQKLAIGRLFRKLLNFRLIFDVEAV